MKSTQKKAIYLRLVATLLIGARLGSAAGADKQVPFSGSLQAKENSVFQGPPPGFLLVDASGSGIATHLGQFTSTWKFVVNLADGTGTGTVVFIAANGDNVFTTVLGRSEPTDTPGVFHVVEIQTITGGAGRFQGAKGSFIVDRLTDLTTGLTSGSFRGTITSPGAAH